MSGAPNAIATVGGEVRALQVMSAVPAGCILVPVADDCSAPHLRLGEFAVVDTSDRAPQHGELYLVHWSSGRRAIHQLCARVHRDQAREFTGWWLRDLVRPRHAADLTAWLRAGRPPPLADGPRSAEAIREVLIGRVVGIYKLTCPAGTRVA